jgi:hypothetical protein
VGGGGEGGGGEKDLSRVCSDGMNELSYLHYYVCLPMSTVRLDHRLVLALRTSTGVDQGP